MKRISSNLIFEELSISNEVLGMSQRLEMLILQDIEHINKIVRYGRFLPTHKEQDDVIELEEKVFDVFNKIQLSVKYFDNQEDIRKVKSYVGFGGAIDEKNGVLILNLFGVNEEVDLSFLRSTLNHELKHTFQICMNKSFDIGGLYKKAVDILQNRDMHSSFLINLSNLIYFLNKTEIDANMESLYQDMKNETNSSNVLGEFEMSLEIFNDLQDYINDENAKKMVLETFNLSLKKIFNYLQHNIEYFKVKKRKVLARVNNERKIQEGFKNLFAKLI